ncbi:MAG: methylmalonyl-CoA epimerase [Longimicrobiales bacterium]|nr:methylmalonyl-CoA epimerase [Longimicrobiales bacterium]
MITLPIDHVAVATDSIAETVRIFERISGARCSPVEDLPAQGVRVAFVGEVELLEPLSPETTVARFLERNGPGLHHIAYRTGDIRAELARLMAEGFQAIDPEPRPGARGHLVAFLHPRGTGKILVELVQHPD